MSAVSQFDLLTPREACAYLRCSRSTLNRIARSGELKKVRLTEQVVRYQRKELERYVERCARRG